LEPGTSTSQPAIEKLILEGGRRGIERLVPFLPANYAEQAAAALSECAHVMITTGFYVDGHAETDGPPGALFLGRALAELGASVSYVGEPYVLDLLRAMAERLWRRPGREGGDPAFPRFVEFPIADAEGSRQAAEQIVAGLRPQAVVAIERCGRTIGNRYANVRGEDISPWTAQVDYLFSCPGLVTVGIGDGGNEIGMGALRRWASDPLSISDPVETEVDHLVAAAVSNWGAYGIAAYLSAQARRDLLPAEGEESRALDILVAGGVIDGLTREAAPTVDGFAPEVTSSLIEDLRRLI
jgi:hypothetical protein